MAADKILKGTACVAVCGLLSAGNFRYFLLTTAATDPLLAVSNSNNIDGTLADVSYELDAGASLTLTYFTRVLGGVPPIAPTTLNLIIYYETGTGTLVRTLHSGAALANGSTFTFYGTADGLVGGAPRAGTLRIFVQAIATGSAGGLNDYNANSDDETNWTQGANVSSAAADRHAHTGVLRSNAKVSAIAVNAYPAGTQFAVAATAVGETITATVTHTQPYAVRGHEDIRIDAIDGVAQQVAGTVKDITNGTSTTQNFAANNTFDAALKAYGFRFLPTGNAQLIPTSGAILWTKFIDDGANVEQDGNNVMRQAFYNVDPRFTAPILFHTQLEGADFLDPPSSGDTPSGQRAFPDVAYVGVRYLNSRGEGVNGLTVTLKMWDLGNVASTESSPAHSTSRVTETRRFASPNTTPEIGWLPREQTGVDRDKVPLTWSTVVSGTWRVKSIVTAPALLTGLEAYQIQSGSDTWNRNLFMVVTNANYQAYVAIHPETLQSHGTHLTSEDELIPVVQLFDKSINKLVELVEANGDQATIYITRTHHPTMRFDYFDFVNEVWVQKANGVAIPPEGILALVRGNVHTAGGDPDIWTTATHIGGTIFQPDTGGELDIQIVADLVKDGVHYGDAVEVSFVGPFHKHNQPSNPSNAMLVADLSAGTHAVKGVALPLRLTVQDHNTLALLSMFANSASYSARRKNSSSGNFEVWDGAAWVEQNTLIFLPMTIDGSGFFATATLPIVAIDRTDTIAFYAHVDVVEAVTNFLRHYRADASIEVVNTKNRHDKYVGDGPGFVGFPTR